MKRKQDSQDFGNTKNLQGEIPSYNSSNAAFAKIGKNNLEESKMSDRDRIEKELKWEIKVQREKGNKSPNRRGK